MNYLRKLLLLIFRDELGWTTEMAGITGKSEVDAAVPEFWAEGVIHDANKESFWGQLAGGEGARMAILDKTGPLKEKGDMITFTTIAQLMGTGVTGENVLKGNEEKLSIGTFTVTADVVRHAVALTWKATKQANFDLVKTTGQLLKDWFTRKFDDDIFVAITGSTLVETLYAGSGNTAVGNLTSTGRFGPSEIQKIQLALLRQGAVPLQVSRVNARTVPIYGLVYDEISGYRLMQNTSFVSDIKESLARFKEGGEHPLFRGAIGMYGNMILYPYYSVLQIPQGTALRPETIVYATCITGATLLSVGGATASAGVTPNYTKFFATGGSLQIGDEILSYTGKGTYYNTFTGVTKGESGTTDVQHVPNELVTQRNVSTVIGFGAEAICRALPLNSQPIHESDDYGEQTGLGIKAYYGHAINVSARRSSKATALVMMKCYSDNPGSV